LGLCKSVVGCLGLSKQKKGWVNPLVLLVLLLLHTDSGEVVFGLWVFVKAVDALGLNKITRSGEPFVLL